MTALRPRVAETARVSRQTGEANRPHPPRVALGRVVATPDALEVVRDHGVDLLEHLVRHPYVPGLWRFRLHA